MRAIIVAESVLLFFSSSIVMTHFGKNPVSGGRPPSDRRVIDTRGSIIGFLFHESDIELIDVYENDINIRNIGIVREI